ncbi:hypothetical protein HGRIS_004122 [Hohenbuehelia grisea]|uniref:Uncharacterized protein n=1 Tax=Hohenbuehelia grisea TaxID=104357 RepID=A0ABR3JHI9_9AGAR
MDLSTAELASIVVQSALYGIYLVLFMGSICVFLNTKGCVRRWPANRYLFTVAVVLFFLITAHWILQIDRIFDGFIRKIVGPDAETFYADTWTAKFIAKTGIYIAQTLIADLTVIYRLYIIWDRNWRVLVLPISAMAVYIAGTGFCFAQVAPGVSSYIDDVGGCKIAIFASSFFINVFVTALISWRIWQITHELENLGVAFHQSLRPVIQILIESAFIYTLCLVLSQILYLTKSSLQIIALNATSPVIGIAFGLLIVRAGARHDSKDLSGPVSVPSKSQTQPVSEVRFVNTYMGDGLDIGVITLRELNKDATHVSNADEAASDVR